MPENSNLVEAGQKILDLAHELANHLNNIVLKASCLQLKADEQLKADIEEIRQQGIQAAGLVRPLQQIANDIQTR
jgi:hypothetical protein